MKKYFTILGFIAGLAGIFALMFFYIPALISEKSTIAVVTGLGVIAILLSGVILSISNYFGDLDD